MAKSLRSKRKMRLRTLKREIAEPLYEKQELKKLAILEAAAEAPKVVITKKPASSSAMEVDQVQAPAITESARMETDDGSGAKRSLKARKTIKKRGKGKFRRKLKKL